jgi:geranylgeranyl diphosphate synthase type I
MNFNEALEHFIPQIEAELRRLMRPTTANLDGFFGMMHYHLGWVDEALQPTQTAQGKLLRPIFTLLCCQAAGGNPDQAMSAAAAVELIHNFSLIHDDIEDNSATRRGRATVWSIWGQPQAINIGDALFTLARHALLALRERDLPLETIIEAVDRLDKTCLNLCRGQFLDMGFEKTLEVSQTAYLEMIEGKTASLLACAGYLGGLIATDSPSRASVFWDLGLALGLAFQIQDDWLGIWGDESLTGKATADDLRQRKKSLPVVYVLGQTGAETDRFKELYLQPDLSEANIAELIFILDQLGAKAYAEELAETYIAQAETALAAIEATPQAKIALQEMAQFLIKRAY